MDHVVGSLRSLSVLSGNGFIIITDLAERVACVYDAFHLCRLRPHLVHPDDVVWTMEKVEEEKVEEKVWRRSRRRMGNGIEGTVVCCFRPFLKMGWRQHSRYANNYMWVPQGNMPSTTSAARHPRTSWGSRIDVLCTCEKIVETQWVLRLRPLMLEKIVDGRS